MGQQYQSISCLDRAEESDAEAGTSVLLFWERESSQSECCFYVRG